MTIVDRIIRMDVLSKAKVKASHAALNVCSTSEKKGLLMQETLTTPRVDEAVTVAPARAPRPPRQPKVPTVEVFKEIIARHCEQNGRTTVGALCEQQTEGLIAELATHFR